MTLLEIRNFLSANKTFEIPIYQRPYVWDNNLFNDLISDISQISASSYHFLGLIVYTEDDDKIQLIDGQQRITSLSILLSVLRDYLYHYRGLNSVDFGAFNGNDSLYAVSACITTRGISNKVERKLKTLNESNYEDEILESIIEPIEGSSLPKDEIKKYLTDPKNYREESLKAKVKGRIIDGRSLKHKASLKAYKFFKNFIEEKLSGKGFEECLKELTSLEIKITQKLKIIPFKTASESEAFKLFEVLNDRGVSVSSVDLLKNICLKNGKDQSQVLDIHKAWTDVFQKSLSTSDYIFFLRTSYNSRFDFIRKNDLYDSFKDKIEFLNNKETLEFLNAQLNIDAEKFNLIGGGGSTSNDGIDSVLQLLRLTGTKQYYPLALSLLRVLDYHNVHKVCSEIKIILELILEIIYSMMVNDKRFNIIEEFLPEKAKSIKSFEEDEKICLSILNELKESLIDFKKSNLDTSYDSIKFQNIDSGIESKNNLYYKLLLLILHHKEGNVITGEQRELEHILPQNPKDSYWTARFKDPEKFIYSIGNMIILSKKVNGSVSNKPFPDKKNAYSKFPFIDVVSGGERVSNIKDWDPSTINLREAYIQQRLKKLMGIK